MRRHPEHNDEFDRAFDALLATAFDEYLRKQSAALIDNESTKWHYELETCTFTFKRFFLFRRKFTLTPIATYLPSKSSWLWAWANDSLPPLARERSARIKTLTEKTKYKIFTSPQFDVTSEEIDELCALALHHLDGSSLFKVKSSEPWLYLVLHENP